LFCLGYEIGCVSKERLERLQERERKLAQGREILESLTLVPTEWQKRANIVVSSDGVRRSYVGPLNIDVNGLE